MGSTQTVPLSLELLGSLGRIHEMNLRHDCSTGRRRLQDLNNRHHGTNGEHNKWCIGSNLREEVQVIHHDVEYLDDILGWCAGLPVLDCLDSCGSIGCELDCQSWIALECGDRCSRATKYLGEGSELRL